MIPKIPGIGFQIGGITEYNLGEVRETGVASACIVSDITLSNSPEDKVKRLTKIWFNN